MLDEKQKSDDRDDESNQLADVGIQAPDGAQKRQQTSACDHEKKSGNGIS